MATLFTSTNRTATPGALEALEEASVPPRELLERHFAGDFGDVSEDDRKANLESLADGSRILSAYKLPKTGNKVWVLTEAVGDDGLRELTTLLLPEEY